MCLSVLVSECWISDFLGGKCVLNGVGGGAKNFGGATPTSGIKPRPVVLAVEKFVKQLGIVYYRAKVFSY